MDADPPCRRRRAVSSPKRVMIVIEWGDVSRAAVESNTTPLVRVCVLV